MKNLFKTMCISLLLIGNAYAQESSSMFTYNIGDLKISLLSESQQNGKTNILIGATDEMIKEYAPDGTFPNAMNAFLVQTPDKNILFDTGIGRKLIENLASLGVTPEQIDIICITHMHGDHIGGMLKDDKAVFPNAEIYLPKPEHDYWTNQEIINKLPENNRNGFLNAIKVVNTYKSKLHLFEPINIGTSTTTVLPGIQGIAAYGHTPGHTGFLLESKGEQFLIWADLTHAMVFQMPHPEIAVTYDTNPADAINARQAILKYVSEKNIPIAGMHIAFPGMGRVEKSGSEGYRFIPLQ